MTGVCIPLPVKQRASTNSYATAFDSVKDRFVKGVGEPYDEHLIQAWYQCRVFNADLRDLLLGTETDSRSRVLHEKVVMHLNLKPSSFNTVLSVMQGHLGSNLNDSMQDIIYQIEKNLRQRTEQYVCSRSTDGTGI